MFVSGSPPTAPEHEKASTYQEIRAKFRIATQHINREMLEHLPGPFTKESAVDFHKAAEGRFPWRRLEALFLGEWVWQVSLYGSVALWLSGRVGD